MSGGVLTRRAFLKGGLWLGASALAADGLFLWRSRIVVERVEVTIEDLAPQLEGLRICLLTDTHHGPMVGIGMLDRAVAAANGLGADVAALTGDFVSRSPEYIAPAAASLARLRAPLGVFAVLGNHDHWVDAGGVREGLAGAGIRVLENSHALVERAGAPLCVAGVEDLYEGRPDAAAALDGVESTTPRILLSHNPDYAEALGEEPRVDLVLSGHTHGGQVRLPFGFAPVTYSRYGQKYRGGLVRTGRTQVYVSRGLGVVMAPVRINCPPELTLIELRGA
ncbi:MAG TPA: metallophosphoesterase [Deltaproteobacteria bacterium]|nr:metallophosphoesterase [Deltaproteobacteria bacterium]